MSPALLIAVIWGAAELVFGLVRRSSRTPSTRRDDSSLTLLWVAITTGIVLAVTATSLHRTDIRLSPALSLGVAVLLIAGGLALRIVAVHTLQRFFTVDVAIHEDHTVIRHGLYRYMRHPSYTGLLASFLGLGLGLGNWLSVGAVFFPVALAIGYRIKVEERALIESLGDEYRSYAATTKRLVPGVF